MSNFEIFSGIYEQLLRYRPQIAAGEVTRCAAFDAALDSINALCTSFKTDAANILTLYPLLTNASSKLIVSFDIPLLDVYIQTKVNPEIDRVKKEKQKLIKCVIEREVVEWYSQNSSLGSLSDYLDLIKQTFGRLFLYRILMEIKGTYFKVGQKFSHDADDFEKLIGQFTRTRFENGSYVFMDPTVTQLYLNHKMNNSPPFSARDVRELENESRAEDARSHSLSVPELYCPKL